MLNDIQYTLRKMFTHSAFIIVAFSRRPAGNILETISLSGVSRDPSQIKIASMNIVL